MSGGMISGVTLIIIAALVIVIAVLCTVLFMRRKKKDTDTRPIIPPSNLSELPVTFSPTMPHTNQPQAIGCAVGAIAEAPPLYTQSEELPTKVPLADGVTVQVSGGQTQDEAKMNGVKLPERQ